MAVDLNQTPKKVEGGIRKNPANQGLNESAMWALIDADIASKRSGGTLNEVETYLPVNKHGNA